VVGEVQWTAENVIIYQHYFLVVPLEKCHRLVLQ
jgi:hypothetical protein